MEIVGVQGQAEAWGTRTRRLKPVLQRLAPPYGEEYNLPVHYRTVRFPARSKKRAMPKSKILIADDNATNVELLEVYLSGYDCEIAVAVDGRDTLEKVATFQPDLILLDIMMPKLSGFEVCEQVKGNPKTKNIMILMVTALNELGDIERAVVAGCDDFLSKPVNKLELTKRVENMLKIRHVTDENERLRRYIDDMEDSSGPQGED